MVFYSICFNMRVTISSKVPTRTPTPTSSAAPSTVSNPRPVSPPRPCGTTGGSQPVSSTAQSHSRTPIQTRTIFSSSPTRTFTPPRNNWALTATMASSTSCPSCLSVTSCNHMRIPGVFTVQINHSNDVCVEHRVVGVSPPLHSHVYLMFLPSICDIEPTRQWNYTDVGR